MIRAWPIALALALALVLGPAQGRLLEAQELGQAQVPQGAERPRPLLELLSAGRRTVEADPAPDDGDRAREEGGRRRGGLLSRLRRGGAKASGAAPLAPEIMASPDALAAEERQALLDFHNEARREVGAPPLRWSPELARFAQEWAEEIARSGAFRHRPRSAHGFGENLAVGTAGAFSPVAMARQWHGERSRYRAGTPVRPGALAAGHYTQMVWRGSAEIGAGVAIIRKGPRQGMLVLVCNYDPPGNVVGEAAF